MATRGKRNPERMPWGSERAFYCVCGTTEHYLLIGSEPFSDASGKLCDLDFGEFEIIVGTQWMPLRARLRMAWEMLWTGRTETSHLQFYYGDGVALRDALDEILQEIQERTTEDEEGNEDADL